MEYSDIQKIETLTKALCNVVGSIGCCGTTQRNRLEKTAEKLCDAIDGYLTVNVKCEASSKEMLEFALSANLYGKVDPV